MPEGRWPFCRLGNQGSSIELPSMPWSDWEVPGDQIEICKRPDGSDWELGAGAFGKVQRHAWHRRSFTQPADPRFMILCPIHRDAE